MAPQLSRQRLLPHAGGAPPAQGGVLLRPWHALAVLCLLAGASLVLRMLRPTEVPTASPLPPPPAIVAPAPVITLAAVGDICLTGSVAQLDKAGSAPSPLSEVAPILSGVDTALGNLECALSTRGAPARKTYTFRAPPARADSLRSSGIDIVSLANNHSVDFGRQALLDTIEALRAHNVKWVGAGRSLGEARQPRVVTFGQGPSPTTVAVLAYSNMLPLDFYASPHRAGTAPARPEFIRTDVKAAKASADFVVVMFHWGVEKASAPRAREKGLAHGAIDAGADVVLGCHPHVLQGFEVYKGGLIAYSLGNFVFRSPRARQQDSAIALVHLQRPGRISLEVVPVRIHAGKPRPAPKQHATRILTRLAALSRGLGTQLAVDSAAGRATLQVPTAPLSANGDSGPVSRPAPSVPSGEGTASPPIETHE